MIGNRTAVVTGATSGIGQAAVRALAGAGRRVTATGRVHAAAFDVRDAMLPPRLNVNRLEITPVSQSAGFQAAREEKP